MGIENIRTENIINGMNKSFNNADSLLQEADILKSNKKFARAYTLCQLAIEELAKIPMLFNLWINRINDYSIDYEHLNSNFTDHPHKTKLSIEVEIAFFKLYKEHSGNDWVDNAIKNGEELLTKIKELNKLKNESLYVSIINDDFQSPHEKIDEEKFNSIYGTALLRKIMFKNLIAGSEKGIDEIAKAIKENHST
jgi:AbiV family abortive infection protein